ncbi:MAG TPA: hypothetical protein VFP33_03035 [Gallionella sp.]|nr:hypothetical protein [Gallionella sp.]
MKYQYPLLLLALIFSFVSATALGDEYTRFKPTSYKTAAGQAIYYDSAAPENSVCGARGAYLTTASNVPASDVCPNTCNAVFTPFMFLAYLSTKKNADGSLTSISWEERTAADRVFFCGFNPETGVKWDPVAQISTDHYATAEEVNLANRLCKNGTDPNIIYAVGVNVGDKESCLAACRTCPGEEPGDCRAGKALECNKIGSLFNPKTCGCRPIVLIPKKGKPDPAGPVEKKFNPVQKQLQKTN